MQPDRSRQVTWVLAGIAVLLVAVFAVLAAYTFTRDRGDSADAAPVTVTVTSTPAQAPAPAPAPPPVTTQPAPTGSTPSEGGVCHESEDRSFGVAADGTSLVCVYAHPTDDHRWSRHSNNDGSVHNLGEPCDPAVDKVAQDPSGKAIMCGGQFWVDGP
ncbi:hypothetical protein RD149_11155 [Gordonia westfalica]|uniref:Serine/threonine protein kinase n=1 Tax=Gordonia westfalica TaxID=158898 RepID=A0ABU2GS87_9ACTN|nr:hypothetical protein [Gordonia westfalica]MDS1114323.1 hypothetical protein [Gordonia westfalica]